jgi:monoamine oxidase
MTAPWVEGAVRSGQLAAQRITATLTNPVVTHHLQ